MERTGLLIGATLVVLACIGGTNAWAQIRPHHSHHPSFNAPQMRRHGGGLYRPNRPHHHHDGHRDLRHLSR